MNRTNPISIALFGLLLWHSQGAIAQLRLANRDRIAADQFQLSDAEIKNIPNEGATQLIRAAAILEDENWEEAIEILRDLAEQYGDHLIGVDSNRYLSVRRYCQMLLSGLPPEALALYRARVDGGADAWHKQAVASENPELLQQVVDHFFCSSVGDDALLALGDRALERGRYNQARGYWEQISPRLRAAEGVSLWHSLHGVAATEAATAISKHFETENSQSWLVYPDTDLNLASVRARLVLASILQEDLARARWELAIFGLLHAEDRGRLAGQEGVYAAILEQLLNEQATWSPRAVVEDWATFAGSPSRNRVLARPLDIPPVPRWRVRYAQIMPRAELPPQQAEQGAAFYPGEADLYFHPLLVGRLALLNNSEQIFAFKARSGEPAFEGSHGGQIYPRGELAPPLAERDARERPDPGSFSPPQHSMTFYQRRLFARIGSQVTSRPTGFDSGYAGNRLICVDLDREGALEWKYPRDWEEAEFDRQKWSFEGPPLADGDGVYVVMRQGSARAVCHVACLDYQSGSLRWRRKICDADTPAGGRRKEMTHNLLTLGEGFLYLNTNLGAIASLRTGDGHVRWVYRYRRVPSGSLSEPAAYLKRGLNPCIYHRGLILSAPRDSRFLLALDASTGRLIWRSAPMTAHPLHLLGVARGMLLATGKSIWWFDAISGRAEHVWPEPGKRNVPRGYGRGLLAGEQLYWPTRDKIFVFDQRLVQEDHRRVAVQRATIELLRPDVPPEQRVTGGNLVAGRGMFLIAGNSGLQAFPLRSVKIADKQLINGR